MRGKLAIDGAVARIASRQHGVITFEQLLRAGLSQSGIDRRVHAGRLHRLHRGVYAVGHVGLSPNGRWLAAVLACGEGAVLSYTSAAGLWRMREGGLDPIHVTVPGGGSRARRDGLRIHRSSFLAGEGTIQANIPVTRPARTLTDIRRMLTPAEYREALRRAEFRKLPIGEHHPDGTRSELERRLLAVCRRHRIPMPQVNAAVSRFTCDFVWPDQRLIVEVDGWDAHSGSVAFEEDRARDVELRLAGWTVLRFTWKQVVNEPGWVARAIREALGI